MNLPAGRSIDVDFLRGLVLIVIALDHTTGSVLSRLMLHSYAFCDSAEVFVFLGGYASAAAYTAVLARGGPSGATRRFLRRSLEIYRAYLFTALLMLLAGGMLALLNTNKAMLDMVDWHQFVQSPFHELVGIALFRHQPYLSSVLPMYVVFALCVPSLIPFSTRMPAIALAGSALVWVLAPWLAPLVPVAHAGDWAFNPFAWQLMFVLGALCRLHPVTEAFQVSTLGRKLTHLAVAVALAMALAKLFFFVNPLPGEMKENLSIVRVVSFIAIAWLGAQAVRVGAVRWLAQRLPSIVTVGRTGLVCFVAGTVVSLAVDTLTFHGQIHGARGLMVSLAGDGATIVALIGIATLWQRLDARAKTERMTVQAREFVRMQFVRMTRN
ncbi:OpgC domain-containing protein [Pararobbsia alpina]|uniref:OpgC protein n=1 Tax=Pararobbsia alpina TaxID=621374 RepID=A0A6S7B9K6_9BURK|nr:OpgC domain-containing protein [Pararobbsia alpina]CAB3783705.1 hypothetical protein LMG28138_01693 [Pararobbsia alpina]